MMNFEMTTELHNDKAVCKMLTSLGREEYA